MAPPTTDAPGRDRTRGRARGVVVGALALVTVAVTVGAASAYWTGRGGGSGTATSATVTAVTLSPATPTAQLAPGGTAGVSLSVTNPNQVSVRVGSLVLDTSQGTSGYAVDAAHAACGLTTLTFTAQTNGGNGWTVPASGSLPVTLSGALSLGAAADNACQGARYTVYLKAV